MITFLSFNDWCGTAWHYCQAYRLYGNATHIRYHNNTSGHPAQICIAQQGIQLAQNAVNAAKLLHFVGDEPVFIPWKWPASSATLQIPDVPKFLTVTGSYFRRCNDHLISSPLYSQDEMMQNTHHRSFVTVDLNYDWFQATYLPLAYDVENTDILWRKPTNEIIIGHSPTNRAKKDTQIIIDAVDACGPLFKLDIIENVSWQECLERKSRCHLFIEDMKSGIWGYSAIEAMAFGIPTISFINHQFLTKYITLQHHPIQVAQPTVESLTRTIQNTMDSNLEDLSDISRSFVRRIHSYEQIGQLLQSLYQMFI